MKKLSLFVLAFIVLMSFDSKKEIIQYNLEKGKVYHQTADAKMDISQEVEGNTMKIVMNFKTKTDFIVKEVHDTFYEVDVKYVNMTIHMNMMGKDIDMDSESKDTSASLNKLAKRFTTAAPFRIKMSKSGYVFDVRGFDEIYKHVFNSNYGLPAELIAAMEPQMKDAFGEEAFKEGLKSTFSIYSRLAVSRGDKWKTRYKMTKSLEADVNSEFELNSVTADELGIKGVSTIKTDPNVSKEVSGMYAFYNLKGDMLSDLKIDRKSSWINSGTITQTIKGNFVLKQNVSDESGYDVPMILKSTIKISND